MKTRASTTLLAALLLLSTLNLQLSTLFAQGTAFTYQGRLNDGGTPANGVYDLEFRVFDDVSSGSQQGSTVTVDDLGVTNGLFTATLDFGGAPFSVGANRWLNVAVRPGASAGDYTNVAPRQPITAAPYAITAGNVTGTVAASQLSGAVSLANLPTTLLVTNGQAGVNLIGTFSGNGAGVTNLDLSLNSDGAINWSGNFAPSSSPGVGISPEEVTAADVNGDGKVDLISANIGSATLSVLTNNGSGGFALSSSPGVGSGPLSVTAADVNGDGRVDLISANSAANTLTVLFNAPTFRGDFAGNFMRNVGIGTMTPIYPLHIAAADPVLVLQDTGPAGSQSGFISFRIANLTETAWVGFGDPASPEDFFIVNARAGGDIVKLEVNGTAHRVDNASTWTVVSDARLKKKIRPLPGALDKLLALHGVNFEYIDSEKAPALSGEQIGFIAQEVEKVFPDWVETGADGYKRVTVRGLEALVVEALRELQRRQETNHTKLAEELKRRDAENVELKARLERLEQRLSPKLGDPQ